MLIYQGQRNPLNATMSFSICDKTSFGIAIMVKRVPIYFPKSTVFTNLCLRLGVLCDKFIHNERGFFHEKYACFICGIWVVFGWCVCCVGWHNGHCARYLCTDGCNNGRTREPGLGQCVQIKSAHDIFYDYSTRCGFCLSHTGVLVPSGSKMTRSKPGWNTGKHKLWYPSRWVKSSEEYHNYSFICILFILPAPRVSRAFPGSRILPRSYPRIGSRRRLPIR